MVSDFGIAASSIDLLDVFPLGVPVKVLSIPNPRIYGDFLRCEWPVSIPVVPVDVPVVFFFVVIPVI